MYKYMYYHIASIYMFTHTHCSALHHSATHCNWAASWLLRSSTTRCPFICSHVHCCTLQHTATHCNTLQKSAYYSVAVCCSVLQCVAVCCSVLQCVTECYSVLQCVAVRCSVLQCVAVRCSVLQCVAVCCSVLQCVAVCCSVCVNKQWRTSPISTIRSQYWYKKKTQKSVR